MLKNLFALGAVLLLSAAAGGFFGPVGATAQPLPTIGQIVNPTNGVETSSFTFAPPATSCVFMILYNTTASATGPTNSIAVASQTGTAHNLWVFAIQGDGHSTTFSTSSGGGTPRLELVEVHYCNASSLATLIDQQSATTNATGISTIVSGSVTPTVIGDLPLGVVLANTSEGTAYPITNWTNDDFIYGLIYHLNSNTSDTVTAQQISVNITPATSAICGAWIGLIKPTSSVPTPSPPPQARMTTLWQAGGAGALGAYGTPAPADGQCAPPSPQPTVSANAVLYPLVRNTAGANGTSTCWRNQMNPIGNGSLTNYFLTAGASYVWTFQTVVTLNYNREYLDGQANPTGFAIDIPAIVFQTHDSGGNGAPCLMLTLQNTYTSSLNGIEQYGPAAEPGVAVWGFHNDCKETDYTGNAYLSQDVLYDGITDNWEIDVVAGYQGSSTGDVSVWRNGVRVYHDPKSYVCDSSVASPNCWWNFGSYFFHWASSNEPPDWNAAGITVQFNNMTLSTIPGTVLRN